MSASLIVLIPLVLLGTVAALCFVGCALIYNYDDYKEAPGPSPYHTKVSGHPNLVACWPLDDTSDTPANPSGTLALDIGPNKLNGAYIGPAGTVKIQQPGIVPADIPSGGTTPSTCAFFNGGFVTVPFAQALNPAKFTLEAWVQPTWTKDDPGVQRAVLVSANSSAGTGYALLATPDNFWEVNIGLGGKDNFTVLKASDPIDVTAVNYLAVTYDGSTAWLHVGIKGKGIKAYASPKNTSFAPEDASSATPLFIGMGRPDMGGMFPFNGFIQDVAVYNDDINSVTVEDHFNTGTGLSP